MEGQYKSTIPYNAIIMHINLKEEFSNKYLKITFHQFILVLAKDIRYTNFGKETKGTTL